MIGIPLITLFVCILTLLFAEGRGLINANYWKMEFLVIESLQISRKFNTSASRERQAVGLGPLVKLYHV